MSIIYKLQLNTELEIEEVDKMIREINATLKPEGMRVMDFNLEGYQDDQALIEAGRTDALSHIPGTKYNFLFGYLNFDKDGKYDDFFRIFKHEMLQLFPNQVAKVMVQEPNGVILDENFVEIPD